MPRKRRVIPKLLCKLCNHGCSQLWGLTQHMLMKHPSHFDIKLGVQGTDSGSKDLPSLNIPSSLVPIMSAGNDNASWPDPLSMPSLDDIPDENTVQNWTMICVEIG